MLSPENRIVKSGTLIQVRHPNGKVMGYTIVVIAPEKVWTAGHCGQEGYSVMIEGTYVGTIEKNFLTEEKDADIALVAFVSMVSGIAGLRPVEAVLVIEDGLDLRTAPGGVSEHVFDLRLP